MDGLIDHWLATLLALLVGFLIFLFACWWVRDEIGFSKAPIQRIEAELLNLSYNPDSRHTSVVPIFGGSDGMNFGVTTTGDSEHYVCIWQTKECGKLKSDDEDIWQRSAKFGTLLIKIFEGEVRIVGFEPKKLEVD